MQYVIPAIIGIENNEVEYEKKLIINYELTRGNRVINIIPFYYPLCIASLNYSYSYVIDPYSSNILKYTYRIPDVSAIIKLVESTVSSYKNPVKIFRELHSIVNKHSSVRNWFEYSIVLNKTVCDKRVLDSFQRLLSYCRVCEPRGVVYKPRNIELVIETNRVLLNKVISDLNNALLSIDYLKNEIIETRYRTEYMLYKFFDKKLKLFRRVYASIDRDKQLDEHGVNASEFLYEYPMLSIIDTGESYDRIRRIIDYIKGLTKITLLKRARSKESGTTDRRQSTTDTLTKDVEAVRRSFLVNEMRNVCREYSRYLNIVNFYTEKIIGILNKMSTYLDKYRRELMRLIIRNSIISDQCVYMRGYVVVGSKAKNVYTTCYLSAKPKRSLIYDKSIRSILRENKIIDQLLRINIYEPSTSSVFE